MTNNGSTRLRTFVVAVDVVGFALLVALSRTGNQGRPGTTLILAALAALAGAFPVRFASRKTAITPTHPFILCALAAGGAIPAALAGTAGVLGAMLRRQCRMTPLRFAFNLGAVLLSTGIAAIAFSAFGGRPGDPWTVLLAPLALAASLYFATNTTLVAIAIALEKKTSVLDTWVRTFLWTTTAFFAGLTLSVVLLVALQTIGPWGLLLGLPPIAFMFQFYHVNRQRLAESQRRVSEVEALNVRLEGTVGELRAALAHVKRLQGLLPICMHCKSIRDDKDTWHRLEAYISEHSEATFTHSLCKKCYSKHYATVRM
jgi:hypothetical protein